MKRVMISGCTGFIGGALTKALLARGVEVYGLTTDLGKLDEEILQAEGFHGILCSFQEYELLDQKVEERDFDAFIHMAWAGYGKATNDYQVQLGNVKDSCTAAYAAGKLGSKKFVFADSSHEFLVKKMSDGTVQHCSIYGGAKASAQKMCRVICQNTQMVYQGVLFTNIYGVGDRSGRSTNTFLRSLMQGKDLDLIVGDCLYEWTYIDDCVQGVLAAVERGVAGKVYYVGSNSLRPFQEIITQVRDLVSPTSKLNFGAYQDDSFIDYSQLNTYDLYMDTGYCAKVVLDDGIKKTIEWLKNLDRSEV